MFNSQKINNDPQPYRYVTRGGGVKRARRGDDVLPAYSERDPRPEYDNNPNPILLLFREDFTGDMRGWTWWLRDVAEESYNAGESTADQLEHAHKVLERLVNVYGTH